MNFEEIENLSSENLNELYNEIIETEQIKFSATYYCRFYCSCSDGTRRYAYGYNYNPDNNLHNHDWQCCRGSQFYISGGCDCYHSKQWAYSYCR